MMTQGIMDLSSFQIILTQNMKAYPDLLRQSIELYITIPSIIRYHLCSARDLLDSLAYLMNQVDTIAKLLTLEKGMKVIEKLVQLLFTVPAWYNYSSFVMG